MKSVLVYLLLFAFCFAQEFTVDYPVIIVDLQNSVRAVVPWDVEDVHGFMTEVKNPIRGEYLIVGRNENWDLNQNLRELLTDEGMILSRFFVRGTSFWQWVMINAVRNVNDVEKLLSILKTDSDFANIAPVDVSDRISSAIWIGQGLTYRDTRNEEFQAEVEFNIEFNTDVYGIADTTDAERKQMIEILKEFDCVFEGCNEIIENPDLGFLREPIFQIRYMSFEQVVELVKNPLVSFVRPWSLLQSVMETTNRPLSRNYTLP